MHAHAWLEVAADRQRPGSTRISRLRSDSPLMLRPTLGTPPTAGLTWDLTGAVHVSVAAAAAGPLGGDRLRLDIDVGEGATLVLGTVTATLLLPGPRALPSSMDTTVRVAAGGTLVWLPEPVIAAAGCDHHGTTRIHTQPGSVLMVREEVVLGRHNEQPGDLRQRLRLVHGHRAPYDQTLNVGPHAPGWDSAAVCGGRKIAASFLTVDPAGTPASGQVRVRQQDPADDDVDTVLAELDDGVRLITALAGNTVALRNHLDGSLASPGSQTPAPTTIPSRSAPAPLPARSAEDCR